MKLKELQDAIRAGISPLLTRAGFEHHDSAFYRSQPDVIQVATIGCLSKRDAHYFQTNTASFSMGLGIYYTFLPWQDALHITADPFRERPMDKPFPHEYECRLRRCLLRDFDQSPRLEPEDVPETASWTDRLRRWWDQKRIRHFLRLQGIKIGERF